MYSAKLQAQWNEVTSFNQVIDDMITFDGKLFLGGNFTKNENSTCYWTGYYDGSTINRHTTMIGGSGINEFAVFDGELYGVGSMQHGFSIGVSKWTGSTWENGGSTNWSHSTIYADGNDLYVVSDDDIIRKKSVGGSFQSFYDFSGSGGVSSIIRYKDKLIFAGSFSLIGGVSANNIAEWDGTNWTPMGPGTGSGISCMVVYNDELYVAGGLSSAGGQGVNKIAKWDGTNWSDVGGGVTGTCWNGLRDMAVYNEELYVVGDYDEMGFVTTNNVAKWNGSSWAQVNINHDDSFVNCVEVYNNNLFVGTFDFDTSHLYIHTGALNVEEPIVLSHFNMYPNPVVDELNINLSAKGAHNVRVAIMDVLGKTVVDGIYQINESSAISIDCSHLNSGSYIILFSEENSNATIKREKFIVR